MPVFEYECAGCGERFELLVRSGNDIVVCPKCGEKKVKKIWSSFGFRSAAGDFSSGACSTCGSSSCSTCGH